MGIVYFGDSIQLASYFSGTFGYSSRTVLKVTGYGNMRN
jgi:hypothetical protein